MLRSHLPELLLDQATEPYRPAGDFALNFARGKLGRDPAFANLLQRGLVRPRTRVLDIGCGHGLARLYCRPLAEWQALLKKLGFGIETLPMHAGTPFANMLLVARPQA